MGWPAKFDPPTREALVLVPSEAAMVQDLGPFRSGRLFETDILPGSALVCAANEHGTPCTDDEGRVVFAFEGNAVDAVNLRRFYEKCKAAAGRLSTQAQSIAYGNAVITDLTPVARFDFLRLVFTEIIDREAIEAWSGEPVESYLPPAGLTTPNTDPAVVNSLCELPMRGLAQGRNNIFAWSLMDGSILTKEGAAPPVFWRSDDEGLDELLGRAGVDMSTRMLLRPWQREVET